MADDKMTLTVKSTAGAFTEHYNANNKAQKVFDDALRRFGLAQGTGAAHTLVREADGRALALEEKLGDLGLVDGDVVVLRASQAQDG
jgi:hypothetical protein